MSKRFKTVYLIFVIFILGFFPFFPRLFMNCDGQIYLARIETIYRNMKDGIFLPSVMSGNINGFGYVEDIFYPGLFYYPAAVLRFILPINISLYICFCLYKFLGMFLTYKIGTKHFDKDKIITFILLYYSNYVFLYDTLIRESFSEYIASIFLPIVFLGIYDLFKNKKENTLFLGMSLILGCHLIYLYLCTVCIAVFCIANIKTIREWFLPLVKAGLKTIILGSYFLIPFVWYFKTGNYTVTVMNNAILTVQEPKDLLCIAGFTVFIILLIILNKKFKKLNIVTPFVIMLYMVSPLFPLKVFSLFYVMQFKRRFYMFLAFFLILVLVHFLTEKSLKMILSMLLICSLAIMILMNVMKGKVFETTKYEENTGYTGEYSLTSEFGDYYVAFVNGEFLPNKVNIALFDETYMDANIWYNAALKGFENHTFIEETRHTNKNAYFVTKTGEGMMRRFYYPFYKVYQEGNDKIEIIDQDGYLYVKNAIPDKEFLVYFENTTLQYIAFFISIIFLGILIFRRYLCKSKLQYISQ